MRLNTKSEFKTVFDNPHKVTQKYFTVLFRRNEKSYTRLGIIVGKRVANRAVTRNRIKRVIREYFRITQERWMGIDVLIIARQHCDTLDNVALREGIDKLWLKLITQYQHLLSK